MARVTVEDCIEKVPNRFELVLLAARRAREISSGASLTVKRDNDKNSVVALREISQGNLSLEKLRENIVKSFQKNIFLDEGDHEINPEINETIPSSDGALSFEDEFDEENEE